MLLGGYLTMEKLPGAIVKIFFIVYRKSEIFLFFLQRAAATSLAPTAAPSPAASLDTPSAGAIFLGAGGVSRKVILSFLLDSFSRRRWKGRENYVFPQLLFQTIIFIGCFPFGWLLIDGPNSFGHLSRIFLDSPVLSSVTASSDTQRFVQFFKCRLAAAIFEIF